MLAVHPHRSEAVVNAGGLQALMQVLCTYVDCPGTMHHVLSALTVLALWQPGHLEGMQQQRLVGQVGHCER